MKYKDTEEDLDTLLDCFTGADGGISFIKLRFFLESLDKEVPSDLECLKIVHTMAELIRVLTNEHKV